MFDNTRAKRDDILKAEGTFLKDFSIRILLLPYKILLMILKELGLHSILKKMTKDKIE